MHGGDGAVVQHHVALRGAADHQLVIAIQISNIVVRKAPEVEAELGVEEAAVGVVPGDHHERDVGSGRLQL